MIVEAAISTMTIHTIIMNMITPIHTITATLTTTAMITDMRIHTRMIITTTTTTTTIATHPSNAAFSA